MATTKEKVAAGALTEIRVPPISSFSDGSDAANTITNVYTALIEELMAKYPWTFALKKRRLNQDSTSPVNEFQYSHIIPAESQRVFKVFDSDAVGAKPVTDYRIVGKRIFSNYENVWIEYTVYTAESNWPGYFTAFAILALAAKIALAITDDQSLADSKYEKAYGPPSTNGRGGKFAEAAMIDAQQQPGETAQVSELISFRFS